MNKLIKTIIVIWVTVTLMPSNAIADLSLDRFDRFIGTDWYGIYMENNKIGYVSIVLEKDGKNRWTMATDMTMTFKMQNTTSTMKISETRVYMGKNAELVSNSFLTTNPAGDIIVEGKTEADTYKITIDIAGQKTSQSFSRPLETLDEVLKVKMLAASGTMNPGNKFKANTFEAEPPFIKRIQHLFIVKQHDLFIFGGVPTDAYIVRDSLPAFGIAGDITVDHNGHIIKEELTAVGLVMKAEPEMLAKKIDSSYDILSNNLIPVENGPENPRTIKQASYIITGYDASLIPESERLKVKTFKTDSVEVTVSRSTSDIYTQKIPVSGNEFADFLQPEPLIQSDNPEIIKLANEIIRDETNAFKAAQLINNWVYGNIKKEFSPDISNALLTLHSKKGDCGEHAALAVALLRATGIPSQIAGGIAYWPEGGGFAFHAWTEVYVGQWIQMDPAWGETFADATHIMLARGSFENQVSSILNALKGLKVSFIDYR